MLLWFVACCNIVICNFSQIVYVNLTLLLPVNNIKHELKAEIKYILVSI